MQKRRSPFVPYPGVAAHGVIGDRRTAALVADDGTIDWLCTPDFDGVPVFGALLDTQRGGYCRFAPQSLQTGKQAYEENTAILRTEWSLPTGALVLTDFLLGPQAPRAAEAGPCSVRRLQCTGGSVRCMYACEPHWDFARKPKARGLRTWTTDNVREQFELPAGDEAWAVIDFGAGAGAWSRERAEHELRAAREFWRDDLARLHYEGIYGDSVHRSALVMRLLTHSPTGGVVAAATSSLPERLGGTRNYDYRFCWIRDASLAMSTFAQLGDNAEATRFLDWLTQLAAPHDKPLKVCYGLRGERRLRETERPKLRGFRGSQPVRFGNRAYKQRQIGSLGYLVDSAWRHLQCGGSWKPQFDQLIARCADYSCRNWKQRDSGLWEMRKHAAFTMSKVMCWVALDRAVRITERTGAASCADRDRWQRAANAVHADVLERGWSASADSFRQRYRADAIDAGLLLMSIMGFLPADDARISATLDRIDDALTIDGFVYRFVPRDTPGEAKETVGEFEGAFLPCTFWLASAYALAGRVVQARTVLERALSARNALGLFAEEFDVRTGEQLGNYPQLFTHAECVRAILELDAAIKRGGRPVDVSVRHDSTILGHAPGMSAATESAMEKSPGHREHPEHAVREHHVDQPLRVEVDGQPIAESRDVILVEEDGYPPRYYFPRADIDMSKLQRSETTTRCPFKGMANYFSVKTREEPLNDAAWTYEHPYEEHRALTDRIAFYDDMLPGIVVAGVA